MRRGTVQRDDDQRLVLRLPRSKLRPLISQRVQEEREKQGWSINEMARMVKHTPATLTYLEAGTLTNVRSETLMNIADVFAVSTDYLLGRSDVRDYTPRKHG